MRILIGVDDSPHSNAAVEFVTRMRWPAGTHAVVVSSVRPVVTGYSEVYVPAVPQTQELLAEQVQFHQELVSRVEQEFRDAGLSTEALVLQGDPRETLVEEARARRADLMVVGSHGRTGLVKLVMGSVASHVVAHAPCSVLVVKLEGASGAKGA